MGEVELREDGVSEESRIKSVYALLSSLLFP